jgi:6,7-dimethyl-8-ribityllumazine synthase
MGKKKKLSALKIAVVVSRFNEEVTEGLLNGVMEAFTENTLTNKNIDIISCPGAFEIPFTAKKLLKKKKYHAVICLGAVIKGETAHFEYISYAVTKGVLQLNLDFDVPVIFGVLTCYNEEQALIRSAPGINNKGREAALAALEMIEMNSVYGAVKKSGK